MRTKLIHPKIKNPKFDRFEFLNPGSVAWQAAKVACGEADSFIEADTKTNPEEKKKVGPKGYELTAMYLLVKNAGGYTIDFETGNELGSKIIEYDKRIPVIMAKDKEMAEWIYSEILK